MTDEYRFEPATQASEAVVRKLLRDNPVSGRIKVSLEREPNALYATAVGGDEYQVILAWSGRGNRPVGVGARCELDAWVNGESCRLGYLSELRSTGGFKFHRSLLVQAYRALRRHHEKGAADIYLTTIIEDNVAARRLLEAGIADMPTYRPLENLITLVIPVPAGARVRPTGPEPEEATAIDLSELVAKLMEHGSEFQFYPCWDERVLRSPERCRGLESGNFLLLREGSDIRACLALWDQRGFKQTVIRGYDATLGRVRPFFNLVAPLINRPRLPCPGTRMDHAFISHVAIRPDDTVAAVALVGKACRKARSLGLDYLMIGLAERNPLCTTLIRHFPCHRYRSVMYVVFWEDGRSAANRLDGRLPHPELAIL